MTGGVVVLAALTIGALLMWFYLFVQLPQQREAAAFARLSGPARRLAIYDAFARQIDMHYYDQSFNGFDWPRLRREGRSKAAAAADDTGLYAGVLVPLAQLIPASHVFVLRPTVSALRANPAASENPADSVCTDRDVGVALASVRRGQKAGTIVGEVWPDSPAERAGVTPGWLLDSAQVDYGSAGGHFKAVFVRLTEDQMHTVDETGTARLLDGRPDVTMAEVQGFVEQRRQRVEFDFRCGHRGGPFETRRLPSGVLYVRFDRFEPSILAEVEAAVRTADDRGVVLDLRSNSGGQAREGLNFLLPRWTPVYYQRDAAGRRLVSTDAWTWRYGGPLAVLIGPSSASAAEITAAALKAQRRAILVGRTTSGSVLGASIFPLPDGGQVEIPVVDIEMADGQRPEGKGVAPDIEIFPNLADVRAGRDPALERAEREMRSNGQQGADGTDRRASP